VQALWPFWPDLGHESKFLFHTLVRMQPPDIAEDLRRRIRRNPSHHALYALSFFDEFQDSMREIARILQGEIRVCAFVQKCQTMPPPAKILC